MTLMSTVGLEFLARNRAGGVMRNFNRSIRSTSFNMRRLLGATVALAGVGGFGYMIRQQLKAIDQIGKMSDELNISTQALTGYEHAALITGTSIETLHKGLEIFVRRLGEAKAGIGEGRRGLDMLGLTAQELINMGMEDAFEHVADRIGKMATAAEQAGAAYNFFGRQGVQLINFFQQGEDGIKALREEAERLGLTFDRLDAAKVEAANDAMTRLKALFTGLFRTLTIELAPFIESAATAFTDWATSGEGAGVKLTNAFEAVALSIAEITGEIELMIRKMGDLTSPIDAARRAAEEERRAWRRYSEVTGERTLDRYGRRRGSGAGPADPELFRRLLREEQMGPDRASQIRDIFNNIRFGEDVSSFNYPPELLERAGGVPPLEIAPDRLAILEQMVSGGPGGAGGPGSPIVDPDKVKEDVSDLLEFVRNAEYMTRTERLQYLTEYQETHKATLEQVEAAEEALHNEIIRLQRARLDQMKVYYAEMKENAQSAYLFQAEAAAEFNRQTRAQFGSIWNPFIDGTKSAKEVMMDFFQSLFSNLAKAIAQMAMLQLWDAVIGPGFGRLLAPLFGVSAGVGHKGMIAGHPSETRTVPALAFAGAKKYHRGLGLQYDEFPAILQEGERVSPAGAGGIQIGTYIERVDATDQESFEGQLYRSRQTLGDLSLMNGRANHPIRRGAMR
jgi:hypothetical protein